jgi:hypothetical protein
MKTRQKTQVLGMIDPHRRYTAKALLRHGGFGPERLAEMRASGIVKPVDLGNFRWYRGDEVIRWLDSRGR